MISTVVIASAVAVGSLNSPPLPRGGRAHAMLAFLPPLMLLGPFGLDRFGIPAILGIGVLSIGIRRFGRTSPSAVADACTYAWLFLVSLSVSSVVGGLSNSSIEAGTLPAFLMFSFQISLALFFADVVSEAVRRSSGSVRRMLPLLKEISRGRAPVHIVYTGVAGLVSLSIVAWGPFGFWLANIPLIAANDGFRGYSAARATYLQTLEALGELVEASGHVERGHHQRVATLAVEVGRELGLWGARLDRLYRAALVHDVGWLALDASDRGGEGRDQEVARAGARILAESRMLAGEARLVAALASPPREAAPIDVRVLRLASQVDDGREGKEGADAVLTQVAPEDLRVLTALRRVMAQRVGPGL